ncbi:MAG: uroporphyrinogen decarboxylase family protein [Deltaproteobacteria bacterium]|nr:uroporphyrinogen decarboxylase family protein [Deltaproteobacteria bacterium]
MNSWERIEAAVRFERGDRTPVFVICRFVLLKQANLPLPGTILDARRTADLEIEGRRRFGWDFVYGRTYYPFEEEAIGATAQFREDTAPSIIPPYTIRTEEDIHRIDPEKVRRTRGLEMEHRLVAELARRLAGEAHIMGYCQGPLRLAGQLRGLQQMLLDMVVEPDFVHRLLAATTEVCILRALSALEAGARFIFIGEAPASGDMISPNLYEEMALPVHQRLVRAIQEAGGRAVLHICGKSQRQVPLMARTGADVLSVDSGVDLAEAREMVGRQALLLGNVDTINGMLRGSQEEVEAEARRCIQKAGTEGGFILSPGCNVPGNTPVENLHAICRAAEAGFPG